jgi:hypothetical protein
MLEQQTEALESREFNCSTRPDARMNLLLRFETASGPRTVIAPGVPLSAASQIADAMSEAGHFAQFVDALAPIPMGEYVKRRRSRMSKKTGMELK